MIGNFKELYAYRVLLYHLVVRELRLRYRGSLLGFFWTFLNPFLLMVVYSVVVMFYMRVQMEDYATFLIVGLLPWLWFQTSVTDGTMSIIGRMDLLSKIKFPPQVLPTIVVSNHFINYLFSLPLLFIFLVMAERPFAGIHLLALPLVFASQYFFTLGVAQVLGALTVPFRDLIHIVNNLMLFWFFATPIIYPASMIPAELRFTMYLNPMSIVAMAYQDILFYGKWPNFAHLGVLLCFCILFMIVSCEIFNHYRDDFVEAA